MILQQIIQKVKNIVLVVLILALAYYYIRDRIRDRQHEINIVKIEMLDKNLNRLVDINQGMVREYLNKNGKIKVRSTYVPPEGTVRLTEDKEGKVTVIRKNKGITFRPGIGVSYDNGRMRLAGSIKVIYWGRLGGIVNVDHYGLSVGGSRFIDDLIPFWHPRNLEIYAGYYLIHFQNERDRLSLGIRVTF